MGNEVILCSSCGITLRPFMRLCPRWRTVRGNATPIITSNSTESAKKISLPLNLFKVASAKTGAETARDNSVEINGEQRTEVIPFDVVRQQKPVGPMRSQHEEPFAPIQNLVFLSPNDDARRFPIFTAAQKTLIAIGLLVLALLLVITYLLFRQQKLDLSKQAQAVAAIAPAAPAASPDASPSPTPTPVDGLGGPDDVSITESVKSALMAYSPLHYNRYKYEVKEGVVTIDGEAEHQPEKDGVENVVRLIAGVKSVVNNLKVKPEQAGLDPTLSMSAVKLNTAEAKVLDDAIRRQIQMAEQPAGKESSVSRQPTSREASVSREARELAAAKQREEEAALKKAAEDRLRRETEEFERRQEDSRRIE